MKKLKYLHFCLIKNLSIRPIKSSSSAGDCSFHNFALHGWRLVNSAAIKLKADSPMGAEFSTLLTCGINYFIPS